jgi:hypothetical protein
MFVYAIKSPLTRKKYEGNLTKFFDFSHIHGEAIAARCASFEEMSKTNPKWVSLVIINFLQTQKQRVERKEISGATVRNYIKAIRLFCEMCDILIAWKKINRGLPKIRRFADDRAPTIEEIQRICEYPD